MCFKPKVSTPQASSIPLPEKIYAPAVVSGVQYGGMNDTASGNADATVDTTPVEETTDTTTVTPTQSVSPAYQQNTSVSTEETAPTKLEKSKTKTVGRKTGGAV